MAGRAFAEGVYFPVRLAAKDVALANRPNAIPEFCTCRIDNGPTMWTDSLKVSCDETIAFERADQNAATLDAHRQDRHRYHIVVARPPNLPLELHDLREFGQGLQVPKRHSTAGSSRSELMTGTPRAARARL